MNYILKGASRVVDLFGKLDEKNAVLHSDYDALKGDWEIVGNSIHVSIVGYGKEQKAIKGSSKAAK